LRQVSIAEPDHPADVGQPIFLETGPGAVGQAECFFGYLPGWAGALSGLAYRDEYLRCRLAHRDAARLSAGRPPTGPLRLRGAETLLTALLRSGLSADEAVDTGLVLTTYVVGFALEVQAAEATGSRPREAPSPEEFPTLTRLANLVKPGAPSRRFGHSLSLVLDGVEARIASRTGSPA